MVCNPLQGKTSKSSRVGTAGRACQQPASSPHFPPKAHSSWHYRAQSKGPEKIGEGSKLPRPWVWLVHYSGHMCGRSTVIRKWGTPSNSGAGSQRRPCLWSKGQEDFRWRGGRRGGGSGRRVSTWFTVLLNTSQCASCMCLASVSVSLKKSFSLKNLENQWYWPFHSQEESTTTAQSTRIDLL